MAGKKRGRKPIEITKSMIKKAERYAAQGLTGGQIAIILGMSHYTLIEKKKENVELVEAINRGKAQGIETITNALFETAQAGNVAAQIFYLKNRDKDGWKDRQELDVSENRQHESVSTVSGEIAEMLGGEETKPPAGTTTH
jgi:hypothetical protein